MAELAAADMAPGAKQSGNQHSNIEQAQRALSAWYALEKLYYDIYICAVAWEAQRCGAMMKIRHCTHLPLTEWRCHGGHPDEATEPETDAEPWLQLVPKENTRPSLRLGPSGPSVGEIMKNMEIPVRTRIALHGALLPTIFACCEF